MHDALHQVAIVIGDCYARNLANQLKELLPIAIPSDAEDGLRENCAQLKIDILVSTQALKVRE